MQKLWREPRNNGAMPLEQTVLAKAPNDMVGVEGQRMLTKVVVLGGLRGLACAALTRNHRSWSILWIRGWELDRIEAGNKLYPASKSLYETSFSGGPSFIAQKLVKVPKRTSGHVQRREANIDTKDKTWYIFKSRMRSDRWYELISGLKRVPGLALGWVGQF
jgi:hypothetical protein